MQCVVVIHEQQAAPRMMTSHSWQCILASLTSSEDVVFVLHAHVVQFTARACRSIVRRQVGLHHYCGYCCCIPMSQYNLAVLVFTRPVETVFT